MSAFALSFLLLGGCLSPEALRPVATQNVDNVQALGLNVRGLLGLSDKYLKSIGESVLRLHVGQVEQQMTSVLNFDPALQLDPQLKWETNAAKAPGFSVARKLVQDARARGVTKAELAHLEIECGWAYTTVVDAEAFTPEDGWKLLSHLDWLRRKYGQGPEAFEQSVILIARFDGTLRHYQELITESRKLLASLRESLERQLTFADSHARAIQAFTQTSVDMGQTIHSFMADEQVNATLSSLAQRSIKNDRVRDAVLGFLKDPGSLVPSSR